MGWGRALLRDHQGLRLTLIDIWNPQRFCHGSGLIGFSVPTPDCRSAQAGVLLLLYTSVYCVLLRGRVRALHVRGAKDRLSGLFSSHHMGLRGPGQAAWLSGVSLAANLSHQTFPSRYVVAS